MREQVMIAGFGGQGILFIGQVLAHAATLEGREVTYFPSYGAEMRGGTANCAVIVSDHKIASPLAPHPSAVIAMNLPSLQKFELEMAPGGVLVLNGDVINRSPARSDVRVFRVPANSLAEKLGDQRVANVVMLGFYTRVGKIVDHRSLVSAISKMLKERQALVETNIKALQAGLDYASKVPEE